MKTNDTLNLSYKAQSRIVYSVSDSSIATVKDGVLTALRSGTTTLYVDALTSTKYKFTRLKVPVTVKHASQTIKIDKPSNVYTGQTIKLNASAKTSMVYTSSNTAVAQINKSTGVITTKKIGVTTITITARKTTKYNSATLSFDLTVLSRYKHVQLRSDSGKWLHTYTMNSGTTFEIPSIVDEASRTFVGWASRKNASLSQAVYYPGDTITVTSDIYLYAVYSTNSTVTAVAPPSLSDQYSEIYIVGDSRANRTYIRLLKMGYFQNNKNVKFIAKEGGGLDWFNDTAREQLLANIQNNQKPTAVVLMLGINQATTYQDYYTAYTTFADEVSDRNVKLFVTTINPINSAQSALQNGFRRDNSLLLSRNAMLKSIPGYTVIDTRSYLLKRGYAFDSGLAVESGIDDGVHYTRNTYLRIFNYVMTSVNKAI